MQNWLKRTKKKIAICFSGNCLFIELELTFLFPAWIRNVWLIFFNTQSGGISSLLICFLVEHCGVFTIFALGVMPYISASIIIQLFTSIVPKLEELKKEGESGRKKLTNILDMEP